ncbi:MAG: hypothetical protein KDA58_08120 [Planctomycetaceae bacterium]|nr:hypothetical protein [Planctomycetaceae bacterium]
MPPRPYPSIRGALPRVCVLLLICVGCGRDEPATPTAPLPTELTWARQLDDVRGGIRARIELQQTEVSAAEFRELAHDCATLEELLLDNVLLDETDLAIVLAHLPHLRQLKLGGPLTSADAISIAQVTTLQFLNVPHTNWTDDDLAHLAKLPHLKLLRLSSPRLTDAGLQALSTFPELRYLHLLQVPITDAALPAIAECEQLQSFYLDGGHCTDAGLSQLIERRPQLHFHWNDLHLDSDPQRHPHD